jgi:nucleoside-diphosphate-sugar epimerase
MMSTALSISPLYRFPPAAPIRTLAQWST